jgi:putative colanic acid biosynthesis acetyltransferase WcaB
MHKDRSPFWSSIFQDWRANARDPKMQMVLALFRSCQLLMGPDLRNRPRALPMIALYRALTELVLGFELRPKTRVGPGLTIYHAYGLVVNDHAIIGRGVVLRNAVVIGQARPGGPSPRIEDYVEVGASALILGPVVVGERATVGAGAVVVKDVPAGRTVVGNPGRLI